MTRRNRRNVDCMLDSGLEPTVEVARRAGRKLVHISTLETPLGSIKKFRTRLRIRCMEEALKAKGADKAKSSEGGGSRRRGRG